MTRDMRRAVTASLLLLFATTASAAPPGLTPLDEPETSTTSYRGYTLAADAVGVGLLVAGGFAEGSGGRDTQASNTLFTLGSLSTFLATPLIHGARGHWNRAGKSLLLRAGMVSLGMTVAVVGNSGCHKNVPQNDDFLPPDFLCELDYVGYGFLGGVILASVLDAAFMTDETTTKPRSWAPTFAGGHDGVRAGVAWTW